MGTPTEAGILEPELRPQPGDTTIPRLATGEPGPETPEDLSFALRALSEAEASAREEDLPIPTTEMLKDTETLLRHLYEAYPCRYDVHPSELGMVIYACPELGRSIMVVRHESGAAWCSVCVPEKNSAILFRSKDFVPAVTLRKALGVMNGQESA